jgi:hypothetical protein
MKLELDVGLIWISAAKPMRTYKLLRYQADGTWEGGVQRKQCHHTE